MVSNIAIAAAKGAGPKKRPRPVVADSQPAAPAKPERNRGAWHGRRHIGASPHSPDGLEEQLGSQLIFSVNELADRANRSPATVFRLLRLGQLSFVQVGGSRCFTRAIVLDFLRRGTRKSGAPAA